MGDCTLLIVPENSSFACTERLYGATVRLNISHVAFARSMTCFDSVPGPTQTCQNCGNKFIQAQIGFLDKQLPQVTWSQDASCYDCRQMALFGRLPVEVQHRVDDFIYTKGILQGMRLLKSTLAIGLTDANFLFHWRYEQLKILTPDKLPLSDETYWDGFIS